MISYYELGPSKKLNEIVMAGSHDAGITAGGGNVKTQDLDIYDQAKAGVRVFDIRITGAIVKQGAAGPVVALKAYHGGSGKSKVEGTDLRTGQATNMKVKSMSLAGVTTGEYGMTLSKILGDAQKFVRENASEFLILKFDKCHNWLQIAEACVSILGAAIYKNGGNLNKKTLRDLAGKVIVLFTAEGIEAVHHLYGVPQGIMAVQNIYGGKAAYSENYHGLQYFGKGGTKVTKPFKKQSQNVKKQSKIMAEAGGGNQNVMGMMYWTTTGIFESIKKRNNGMWAKPNVAKLQSMWDNGLNNAIMSRVNTVAKIDGFAGGHIFKSFMPNIVMIDFADDEKCRQIFELNTTPVTFLVDALGEYAHA
ncbi:MAG TPA: hypothetical protein VK629_06095 [Steroidobacteraceae bacterium]|nr:hypothetical protein [Steroidobacteraceae bacterium]